MTAVVTVVLSAAAGWIVGYCHGWTRGHRPVHLSSVARTRRQEHQLRVLRSQVAWQEMENTELRARLAHPVHMSGPSDN